MEEAVVNSLYHRSYIEREPVEITIEPDKISILNFGGPNHTISMQAIREARMLRSRRYTNRRLGEFLKELDLTEGRATGIPTIQQKLLENGSSRATIETDEERTYFLIDIPCNQDCLGVPIRKECKKECKKELSDLQKLILDMLSEDSKTTIPELAGKMGMSARKVSQEHKSLREEFQVLKREGGRKNGYWVVCNYYPNSFRKQETQMNHNCPFDEWLADSDPDYHTAQELYYKLEKREELMRSFGV